MGGNVLMQGMQDVDRTKIWPAAVDVQGRVLVTDGFTASAGGTSSQVTVTGVNAKSAALDFSLVLVTGTEGMFMRQGADPTAVSNGTDQYIPPGVVFRVGITSGNKLAFISAGTNGVAYITPVV